MIKPMELIMQVLLPSGNRFFTAEFTVEANNKNETINKIIHMNKIALPDVGDYTVNILRKDNMTVIGTFIFNAAYPARRSFTKEEIDNILSDNSLVKSGKVKVYCPTCNKEYKLQLNLDVDTPIDEEYTRFPSNDLIICCDKRIELTGIRRVIELSYGKENEEK